MIQFICPNNNIPERTYIIEALFTDVLGLKRNDYSIQFNDDVHNYELIVGGKKYTIEDHFFNRFVEPLCYLKSENIPTELRIFHGLGMEIPIIYGEDKFVQNEAGAVVGLDIFASSFFMLTRWEESLLGREEKGDCDESQLFCVKHGIHQRPIVNEYVNLLRKLFPTELTFTPRNYTIVLSHDVDGFLTPTWTRIAKDFLSQTIHGAPQNQIINLTWKEKIKYKRAFPNAFSQFELYTALTEKYNIPEWFYFKVCDRGETEATYYFNDKQTFEIVNKLKANNNPKYILGFHPSQNTFGRDEQWNKEVLRITELLHEKPEIGRNHHLLYNNKVFRLWENISEQSLSISNCVFHYRLGFRSGVCVPYHLFDLFQRRVMNLVEYPCQIMDTAIRMRLMRFDTEEVLWDDIRKIINQVKKNSGCLILTWHIYIRSKKLIMEYYQMCDKVLQYGTNEK